MFPDLLLNAIFEPCTIHPVLFRWEEDTVTFEGIPYPPHFLTYHLLQIIWKCKIKEE
jgi:hypothetical protein